MKRKITLGLVLVIISALLLIGCHPIIPYTKFPGYHGERNASDMENIYNNYAIKEYLDLDDPRILKSKNEENFQETVKKCKDLQDIGFESSFETRFNSSNTLILSVYDILEKFLDSEDTEYHQLEYGIFLNQVLFNVAAFGNLKDIDDILENGLDQFLDITDGQGLKLISVAINYNNMENIKYLLELDHNQINEALDDAVRVNNLDAAEYLIEKGGKLPESNEEEDLDDPINSLPLACLTIRANRRLADFGLDAFLSVDMSDQQGKQCIAMLELLKQNNYAYTNGNLDEAVSYAAAHGEKAVLEYLLKNYGTPQFSKNALNNAADVETIKLLQRYGADVPAANKGAAYVGMAAKQGDYEKLQYYLSIGADPNGLDTEGKTPLYYAVKNGKMDMVKLLVEKGAQVNAESLTDYEFNNMMANIISVNGSDSILDYLIVNGYDINSPYKNGETPMTELIGECIASYGQGGKDNPVDQNQLIGAMLWDWLKKRYYEESKAGRSSMAGFDNSDEFNEAWNNLMHEKYLERIGLLLKYKANPTIKNAQGKSAYDIANEKGFEDIVRLFDEAGYKNG